MSEKNNLPQNDGLREQFDGIDRMVTAPDRLVEAAKSGMPLSQNGNRYTPGFHVRKFAHAAVLYVVGIGLFIGFLLLLPALFQGASPVGGEVSSESSRPEQTVTVDSEVTDERDLLMVYAGQSNEERALWKYVWRVVKQNVPSEYTINDLQFGAFKKQYGDLFVCYLNYEHCVEYPILTGVTAVYSETVAGYEFRYGYNFSLSVFANYAQYDLPEAYAKGILTQEQVRTIWEDYKAMHPCYYQIAPDGVIPTPN